MTGRPVLLLATRNQGKLAELAPLAASLGWQVETLAQAGVPEHAEEADLEVAETFEANALAKARYFAARTGRLVVSEDSGLEVEALGGAPGVRSKRWSADVGVAERIGAPMADVAALEVQRDAANMHRLQAELLRVGAVTPESRGARFVCVAVAAEGGRSWSAAGEAPGVILLTPCGTRGFGYDPVFWSTELGACFGDVSREAKNRVSHRARAVSALLHRLGAEWGAP
jgi:XTP/dITP diphosphohydrolase